MSVIRKPEPEPEPELKLPPTMQPKWPRGWKSMIAEALPLLGLTPTELAVLSHLVWHGRNFCWSNYEGADISVGLTGHTGCSAARIRLAIPSLLRRGYLHRWNDERHRTVLQVKRKLLADAVEASWHCKIFQAVGTNLWKQLGGYTPARADEVNRVGHLVAPHDREEKRWQIAAWQMANNNVVPFEAARAARH